MGGRVYNFVLLPLIALFLRLDISSGISLFYEKRFWRALFTSTHLSLTSSIISVALAIVIINSKFRLLEARMVKISKFLDFAVSIHLIMPAIVFATGCFILLKDFFDIFNIAYFLVLLANILFTLPFIVRILAPKLEQTINQQDKLCMHLGITGVSRFFKITLPALASDFHLVFALSFAFSLGDLSVITLFGSQNFETLPFYLYQLFGRYGGSEADILGIFILIYIFIGYLFLGLVFWCLKKIVSYRLGEYYVRG